MLRSITTTIAILALVVPCWAQFKIPLTEPTNRAVPPQIATANVYCYCKKDQSIAFVPADKRSSVHQIIPTSGSAPKPIEFPGVVKLLSCSPDGETLAALVENTIYFAKRDSQQTDHVAVSISPKLDSPSEFKWSADSKVVFAVRSDRPASVTRIVLDQSEPEQDFTIGNRIHECFPSLKGDLFVTFTSQNVEIWRKGVSENKIVEGRSKTVSGSADGRFIAFRSDRKLQVWTLDPLGKGATVAADDAKLIRFSDDGKRLVVAEVDDKVKCYSVSDDGQLSLNQEYDATNGCGWLSGSGTIGACSSYSDTSRLMRVFNCEAEAEIEVPVVGKATGGYDPDIFPERYLLSKNGVWGLVEWPEGRLELFDIRSQLSIWGCQVPDLKNVWMVDGGEKLLTIDKFGRLQIHDTTIGRVRRHSVIAESTPQPKRRMSDTQFRFEMLPDGKHCVVWCGASRLEFIVIELATRKIVSRVKTLSSNMGAVRAWRPSDDGSIICVVRDEIELLRTGFQSKEFGRAENSGRFHMAVKPFRAKKPTHSIHDTESGQKLRTVEWDFVEHDSVRNWAHVSRDGKMCALVARQWDGDGTGVEVRSTETGEKLHAISLGDTRFSVVKFSRDNTGMWILTDHSLMQLNFAAKTLTPFFTDSETSGSPIEFDPKRPTPLSDSKWQTLHFESFAESDTGWIATGHHRGFVNIWSTKDRQRYAFIRCGTRRVETLAFSPDGRYLMSWCADRNQLQVSDLSSILPLVPPDPMAGQDVNLDF